MSKYVNKRVDNVGIGQSDWLLLGSEGVGWGAELVGIQVEASATAVVTIQCTCDEGLRESTDTVAAARISNIVSMVDLAANSLYSVNGPIKAVRINQTAGVGTSAITVLQTGE